MNMHSQANRKSRIGNRKRRSLGLSLIEMLVALAITAVLLTATMVAIDASFQAYAAAAESASTQTATRMIVNRLLTMVRTSTAHGPLAQTDVAVGDPAINFLSTNQIESQFVILVDLNGDFIRLDYDDANDELLVQRTPSGGVAEPQQVLLGNVTDARFVLERDQNAAGEWVLERATMQFEVAPDDDNTLQLEASANMEPIRVFASSKPRRVEG